MHQTLPVFIKKNSKHIANNNAFRAYITTGTRYRVSVLGQEIHQGHHNQKRCWGTALAVAALMILWGYLTHFTDNYVVMCFVVPFLTLAGTSLATMFPSLRLNGRVEAVGQVIELLISEIHYGADKEFEYWVAARQLVGRENNSYGRKMYFRRFFTMPLGDTKYGGEGSPRLEAMVEYMKGLEVHAQDWLDGHMDDIARWEERFQKVDNS